MRHLEIRPGLYRDSVQLMQVSAALATHPGVDRALVAMATPLNLELLPGMGMEPPTSASPNDLLVAFVARDENTLAAALEWLERDLAGTSPSETGAAASTGVAPRTTATAARAIAGGGVALVSTPGRYAFVEAMDALDAGLSVMVFSDNVPVDQELALKRTAAERGLLVMGPDCGTAVIGGVGLGFANVVRPGPVGLVAASGTGAQQLMSLLAVAGIGISHCLGVGGRDLSDAVGGASAHAALDALDAEPGTQLIVVLGKPPAPRVADEIRDHAQRLVTPVIVAPLGLGQPDVTTVAADVLARLHREVPSWPAWPSASGVSHVDTVGAVRGLFSGGTLCVEAMAVTAAQLGPVYSNVPLRPEWSLSARTGEDDHVMLDLGADEYTLGRPHPMIDLGPRLALIADEAARPSTRVLLLDVVLGHGAHPDPAAELAPAIRAALSRVEPLTVVASLVGTPDDPQGIEAQAAALTAAGAWCYLSNAAAARHAATATGKPAP